MNRCNWCGFKAEYIQENKWPEEQDLEDILCGACLTILETPANELKNDQKFRVIKEMLAVIKELAGEK